MRVYLDNAATTQPFLETRQVLQEYLEEGWFNPSSLYRPAVDAFSRMNKARSVILQAINARQGTAIFTSGGTEGNNAVIFGLAKGGRKKHFVTTAVEHSSVYQAMLDLKNMGHDVDFVYPRRDYTVHAADVAAAIRPNTALVSVMHVNNETGAVNDIANIAAAVKRINPSVCVHSDGVQAFMKLPVNLTATQVDMYTVSAHKVNAFKGTGALYLRDVHRFKPLLVGGGQENNLRSGTENTFGIFAFEKAVELHMAEFSETQKRLKMLKNRMMRGLAQIEGTIFNMPEEAKSVANLINVSFLGVRAETLLHALENFDIYVGTGSACSSKKSGGSRVLKAHGIAGERLQGAVRISLGVDTTAEQVDYCLNMMAEEVKNLRRFQKR